MKVSKSKITQHMRYRRNLILAVLIGPIVAVVVTIATSPFIKRMRSYPNEHEITSVNWYQPQVAVGGAHRDPQPWEAEFPSRHHSSANEDAMPEGVESAHAYARLSDAQAYIHWKSGEILVEDYAGGFGRNSRFNSMSMMKTVLALLVGQAIERGVIPSIHSRLRELIPETSPLAAGTIPLENFLQMTSGLDWNESQKWPGSDLYRLHFGSSIPAVLTSVGAGAPPGQRFSYANGDAQWVAQVLEARTGKKLSDLLSEWLWNPIGAAEASLWLDHPGGTAHGYCCLFATAQDWLRIGQLMIQQGKWKGTQLVPSAWISKMLTPSQLEPGYGYFTWLATPHVRPPEAPGHAHEIFRDPKAFYLSGQGKQAVIVLPQSQQILIRLGERPKSKDFKWDAAKFANSALEAMPEPQQQK